jgi:hypothetical protein
MNKRRRFDSSWATPGGPAFIPGKLAIVCRLALIRLSSAMNDGGKSCTGFARGTGRLLMMLSAYPEGLLPARAASAQTRP